MSSIYPTVMPHRERLRSTAAAHLEKTPDALRTAPFDPRFPNQNQTRYCYQSYLDLQRCNKLKGEDYEACQYFKRVVKSICPIAWIEKWDNQIAEGVFVGRI